MKPKPIRAVLVATLCAATYAAMLAAPAAGADRESFAVRLSPAPRDAAMRKIIAGHGSVSVTIAGNELTLAGTFEGFSSAATHAAIHRGPAVGIRGPAVYELTVSKERSGNIAGSATLSPDALAGLNAGQLYIQIESETAPDGNVWGWLLPAGVGIVRDL
jgi:hypothetical protein